MIKQLDYPGARILMEATTEVEEGFRLGACKKEPWTVQFIEGLPPGSWFVDVGANVGSYTLLAVARGLQVVAIEPGYENYARMCHNLALNNWLDRAIVICGSVGNLPRLSWFHYSDLRAGGANHILGGERKATFHRQVVLTEMLDDIVGRLCADGREVAVKIDVDGSELEVLEGMRQLLGSEQLKSVLVEMQLDNEAKCHELLTAQGWRMVSRYDEREGQRIANVCYGQYTRS